MSINAITGYSGIYTAQAVSDPSIRYGRNAAKNMEQYVTAPVSLPEYELNPAGDEEIFAAALEKFATALEQDEFTRFDYRYEYSMVKEGEFDKLSMLGAAYEEMNGQEAVPVKAMTKLLKGAYPKEKLSAKPLDTNKNGKVEIDEYAAFLALSDIKSKDKGSEDVSKMDGSITNEGIKETLSYLAAASLNPIRRFKLNRYARGVFGEIQTELGLGKTKEEFQTRSLDFIA